MFKKEKRKSWRSVQSPFIFNLARHLEAGSRYVDGRVVADEVESDKIFKNIDASLILNQGHREKYKESAFK